MPGRQRGRLIEKEQLGVEPAPDVAMAALEVEHAANPLPRCPAPRRQRLRIGMETPAAIAQEQSACRHSSKVAERVYAICSGIGRLEPSCWPVPATPRFVYNEVSRRMPRQRHTRTNPRNEETHATHPHHRARRHECRTGAGL